MWRGEATKRAPTHAFLRHTLWSYGRLLHTAHNRRYLSGRLFSALRETFWTDALAVLPQLRRIAHALPTNAAVLDMLLTREKTLHILAHFVASVFELCNETPCLIIRNDDALLALDL